MYQGVGRGLGVDAVERLERAGRPTGSSPTSWSCSTSRRRRRRPAGPVADRFEREGADFHAAGAGRVPRLAGPGLGRRRRRRATPDAVAARVWAVVAERRRPVGRRRDADVDVGRGGRSGAGGRRCCSAPRPRPVHAYLLVGPRGSGDRGRGAGFAAMLIGADGDRRAVLRGRIPTSSSSSRAPTCTRSSATCATRSCPRCTRARSRASARCVVLLEADRLNQESSQHAAEEHRGAAAADDRDPRHRVRGRAARHDPVALPAHRLRPARPDVAARRQLERDGVPDARPRLAARARGRRLDRAVALAGPLAGCATRSSTCPRASTATARPRARARRGLDAVVKDTLRRARGRPGGRARGVRRGDGAAAVRRRAPRRRCASGSTTGRSARPGGRASTRCSRASPRSSRCTATRSRPARRRSTPTASGSRSSPAAAAAALDACREARAAFEFNPSEGLLLERAAAPPPGRRRERRSVDCPASAGVAQSVEQLTRNEQVRSSNLLPGSISSAGRRPRGGSQIADTTLATVSASAGVCGGGRYTMPRSRPASANALGLSTSESPSGRRGRSAGGSTS